MIKLLPKKTFNAWIEIDGVKLLIDYPTIEQSTKLQSIIFAAEIDSSKFDRAEIQLRYAQLYLRYTIKDWEGVNDEAGEVKCKLINNELSNEQWEGLISDTAQTLTLFGAISAELGFSESDKKKSFSE